MNRSPAAFASLAALMICAACSTAIGGTASPISPAAAPTSGMTSTESAPGPQPDPESPAEVEPGPDTESSAPPEPSTQPPTESATPTPDPQAAALEKGADYLQALYLSPDPGLATPGSTAHLFMEARQLYLPYYGDESPTSVSLSSADGGWQVENGPLYTDFALGPDGLVASYSRDGRPSDGFVRPGSGETFSIVPTAGESWTGQVNVTVHSTRFYNEQLQLVWLVDNQSSEAVAVFSDSYSEGGDIFGDSVLLTQPGQHGCYIVGWGSLPAVNGGTGSFGLFTAEYDFVSTFSVDVAAFSV